MLSVYVVFVTRARLLDRCNSQAMPAVFKKTENQITRKWRKQWNNKYLIVWFTSLSAAPYRGGEVCVP